MLRTWSVIATLAAVSAPAAMAQGTGCEDAARRVGANALPRAGSPQWNDWVTLTGCGSRGATVIGSALRSDDVRRETELTRLDQLSGMLDGWFQPSLVSAYEWVLRAPDTSYGMRLRAMWLLAGLYVPDVEVAGPLQGYMSAQCETYERTTSLREAPSTLPAEAYDQAASAVAFAAADATAPEYVRTTARCWEGVIQSGLTNGTQDVNATPVNDTRTVVVNQPAVVVARPVRVVYECGTRFVFYNDAGYDLAIRYQGYGAGVLRVAPGGPFVWVATRFDPVRFWLGDSEIWYSDAVYRPCGPRLVYAPAIYPWYGWRAGLGVFISTRVGRPGAYFGPRVVYNRPVRPYRPGVIVNRGGHNDGPRGGYVRGGTLGDRDRDSRGYGYRGPRGPGQSGPSGGGTVGGPTSRPAGGGTWRPPGGGQRVAVPKGGGVSRSGGYQPRPGSDRGARSKPSGGSRGGGRHP